MTGNPEIDSPPSGFPTKSGNPKWTPLASLEEGLAYTDTGACALLGGGTFRMDTRGEFWGGIKAGVKLLWTAAGNTLLCPKAGSAL